MSDEKIDRIDKKLTELVTITANLVVGLKDLNDKVDRVEKRQEVTDKKADRTNAILEDALSRIIDLQKGQNEINSRIENLEERVEIVEDKIAA